MNTLSSSIKGILSQSRHPHRGSLLKLGTLLSAPLFGMSLALADDVPCSVPPLGTSKTCLAQLSGTQGISPGKTDSHDNGESGTTGGPTDSLIFSLTSGQFVDYQLSGLPVGVSPVYVGTVGGTGRTRYHGTQGLADKLGGQGGNGGLAGDITATIASGVSGVSSGVNGVSALTIESLGGAGGGSGKGTQPNGVDGTAGLGANGGAITATVDGTWNAKGTGRSALITSIGGEGGSGGNYEIALMPQGANGNQGGNGGNVNVTLQNAANVATQFDGSGGGILIQSVGGAGGQGGNAEGVGGGQGGQGGQGGTGGNVTVTVGANVSSTTSATLDAALAVQSIGGQGGAGGSKGGSGGWGGTGNNAGDVSVTLDGGFLQSTGPLSAGLAAQSFGGSGGDGGSASHFVIGPNGGGGSQGGTPGSVSVMGSGVTIETGEAGPANNPLYEASPGVLAQSIGGGGGSGSSAKGVFAVGGDGGTGGTGNPIAGAGVTVDLKSSITTWGFRSDGIMAQSIGGGGGKGGDATGPSAGLQMTVGGTGGNGGNGGAVSATSEAGSIISTAGGHASGMVLQSIGGGGGDGGAAYSKSDSVAFDASIAVGGSAGSGGNADSVGFAPNATTTNAGQISTLGSDSYGILGQAIGGGGGVGGASVAKAYSYGLDDYPNITLSAAIGGSGGSGGAGGTVQIGNAGLVTTSSAGAGGMLAQSIGGGGGVAGDASASSTASGGAYSLAAAFAFGGKGTSGGDGQAASVSNTGLVVTLGESADGVSAQSIGGGGGAGGAGDSKTKSTGDTSLSTSITMGGSGGAGGNGGSVTATNSAATILTLGDGAIGLMAQSIGGGGGRAGGAAGSAKGADFNATVNVGGSGGAGGSTDGSIVTANNTKGSVILTYGADATGILAQSVGGGGGTAGKSASNLGTKNSTGDGGNSGVNAQTTLADLAKNFNSNPPGTIAGYTNLSGAINLANALLGNASLPSAFGDDDPTDELDDTAESRGKNDDDNQSPNIKLTVTVGGSGGAGGNAGAVNVNNAGAVATVGDDSDGIIAQAIGGGGGKGGASSTAFSNGDSGTITLGGAWDAKAAGGGNGGQPTVVNSGTITTAGVLAEGIIAQSIAGGGGIAGVSATSISSDSKNSGNTSAGDGAFSKLLLSIGAENVPNHGDNDISSQVYVTSSGAIQTLGHDSSGIVAQSIAGGGGIEKTIATDLEGGGGSTSSEETNYNINLNLGSAQGVGAGFSGLVNVTTQSGGTITTSGDDSYGILAQSIAGGGGLVLGGKPVGTSGKDFFGSGKMIGSVYNDGVNNPASGNSGLFVTVGDDITTSGKGSIGVLAQSIGGGGGLAGDTGDTEQYKSFGTGTSHSGSGGYVGVTVNQGASVSTSGENAPAMFLQSIGGGGGRITNDSGAYIGTAGGSGQGGSIDVTVNGTVQATGQGSGGIFAQSEGDSTSNSPISITVGVNGKIVVGQNDVPTGANGTSAAIYVDHGGMDAAHANTITNDGLVQTYGSGTNAVAVYNNAGYTSVINNGTMAGDVLLANNNGSSGCFANNGTFNAGDSVTVGNCPLVNAGTINVGGPGVIGKTTIIGDYDQTAGGHLVVDADFAAGKSDVLTIDGAATIAGTIDVQATSLRKSTLEVMSATGPLTLEPTVQASSTHLYSYRVDQVGNTVEVTPQAHFVEEAASFGHTEQAVANTLQSIFDSGAPLNGFSTLAKINGGGDYASGLRSIAGEGLGAFGAFRINSSRSFTFDLYGGCREMTSDQKAGDSCTWARVFDRSTDQDARNDTVGYHADAYTLEVGGQVSLSENLALVVAAGSENSTMQDDERDSQINGNTAIAGASLNYANGPVELSGAVDGAYGSYRSTRTITVADDTATATAEPRQWQIGAHLRAAYSVPMFSETYYVKPFIDGHAIYVSDDAFTESGTSPFNLTVDGRSDTALLGGVGTEFGAHYRTSSGAVFHPFVSLEVEFDSSLDWTTTAHFADQSAGAPFSVRTAGPGTLGRLAVGADVVDSSHWSFSLMYDPDVGHGYTSQAGSARVSYRF